MRRYYLDIFLNKVYRGDIVLMKHTTESLNALWMSLAKITVESESVCLKEADQFMKQECLSESARKEWTHIAKK